MRLNYTIEGFEALARKLPLDKYVAPLRTFWDRVTMAVEGKAKQRAPYRTGRLQGSIRRGIDGRPVPMYGFVGTDVTERGVSYPTILEKSAKTHYRATSMKGQQTQGWLGKSPQDVQGDIERHLESFAKDVERAWRR